MARKRAQQRWSALLSRIDKQMRLDAASWATFVAHANAHYKPRFVAAFHKPMLTCVGPSYGAPCGYCVDLTSRDAFHEHLGGVLISERELVSWGCVRDRGTCGSTTHP